MLTAPEAHTNQNEDCATKKHLVTAPVAAYHIMKTVKTHSITPKKSHPNSCTTDATVHATACWLADQQESPLLTTCKRCKANMSE